MNAIEELIQRYLDNKATDEERLHLMRLIRSGAIEQSLKKKIEQTFNDERNKNEIPDFETNKTGEEIFNALLERTKQSKPPEIMSSHGSFRQVFLPVLKYAAVFLVLVIGGIWFYTRQANHIPVAMNVEEEAPEVIQVVNTERDTKKIVLHDGSTIALEPGSKVRYAKKFADTREVYLSGDAFFEVVKDSSRPFLVYANEVTTKVLGTSFRVKANDGEKEIVVAVKTGKVTVYAKSEDKKFSGQKTEEITLTPNQQAVYKRVEHIVLKQIVEMPEVISTQAAIKNSYVNEPVVLILNALSESYGVDIRYDEDALSGCTLTSDIIEGEGLYEQLEIVCSALGGKYKMESDASIVIEAGGCLK